MAGEAIEAVVNESFPPVARLAYALTGSNSAGDRVVQGIVAQGLRMLPTFRDEGEPHRWFMHHTILACRRECSTTPAALIRNDLLLLEGPAAMPEDVAFTRAVRRLPQQQIEALLLSLCEGLPIRAVSVAMDCSTAAAQQHLESAMTALRALTGEAFDAQLHRLRQAYLALTPPGGVRVPRVERLVRRHVWPRRVRPFVTWLFVIVGLMAMAWICWNILPKLEF